MKKNKLPRRAAIAAIAATIIVCTPASGAVATTDNTTSISTMQLARIAIMAGEWQVKDHDLLRIVFEPTAGGTVIIEKWMLGELMHSLTIYHLDGERLIATHYCPQGNQPRLAAAATGESEIRFSFLDVTGLDTGESFQHDLSFKWNSNGTISRAETYMNPNGAGEESTLTLYRASN